MRRVLGCTAVLVLACAATAVAQPKIDAKKLVGKWEPVPDKDKKEKLSGLLIVFTDDGKVTMAVAGAESRAQGIYELKADKLAVTLKVGDREEKDTLTVKKLTDDELVTEDSKGRAETLRRKR
jgi:uncharacterized protein (TIGR03066 family)